MILSDIPEDKLVNLISEKIIEQLSEVLSKKSEEELIKPKEAARLLQISAPTLDSWTKKGLLNAYKIGRRKFYKKAEVLESLTSSNRKTR